MIYASIEERAHANPKPFGKSWYVVKLYVIWLFAVDKYVQFNSKSIENRFIAVHPAILLQTMYDALLAVSWIIWSDICVLLYTNICV